MKKKKDSKVPPFVLDKDIEILKEHTRESSPLYTNRLLESVIDILDKIQKDIEEIKEKIK